MPKSEEFRIELERQIARAEARGLAFIEVISGELHRNVGGYPDPDHRMPACCSVMRAAMRGGDQIVHAPPSGQGATLRIRYQLPR